MSTQKLLWLTITGLVAAALAGCAEPEPEQAVEDIGDDRRIAIDGNVYECDDTIQTDDACQEWIIAEDADAQPDATYESDADGSVTIEGQRFVCDDTQNVDLDAGQDAETQAGACEEYVAAEEA